MKNLLVTILNALNNFFVTANLNKTARELLKCTDSRLLDIGVSRHLLLKGAEAYPWREPRTNTINSVSKSTTKIVETKVSEPANSDTLSAA